MVRLALTPTNPASDQRYARRWRALDERIRAFDAEFADTGPPTSMPAGCHHPRHRRPERDGACRSDRRRQHFRPRTRSGGLARTCAPPVTTGGRPRLLGITKRGSKYLRKMLIQGARAALPTLKKSGYPIWAPGCVGFYPERMAMSRSSRLAARWRASSGRLLRHARVYEATPLAA